MSPILEKEFWNLSTSESLKLLESNSTVGLTDQEIQRRQEDYGPNAITTEKQRTALEILLSQFKSLIVLLLVTAAFVSTFLQQWVESLAIFAVLVVNTLIGFLTELKAVKSMQALKLLGHMTTTVCRNGQLQRVNAEDLVPGDIALFEAGDVITADIRLLESSQALADESSLTGESIPVEKQNQELPLATVLPERNNMLFKGTALVKGSVTGIVVNTAMNTEIGRVATITQTAKHQRTPLEKRLDRLGHRLLWLTLGITIAISISGILAGKDWLLMFETAVALAVATIPEGLPIVATIALAKGMWQMARKNALINKLSAVETLGATTLILTDKTGTLTENRMTARYFSIEGSLLEAASTEKNIQQELRTNPTLREAIHIGALCNKASIDGESFVGDPMEIGLLVAAKNLGWSQKKLLDKYPRISEEAFSTESRKMATLHKFDQQYLVTVKGAPESVLDCCKTCVHKGRSLELTPQLKAEWQQQNDEMAAKGLRILALARKFVVEEDTEVYKDLELVALVGFEDPPRADVKDAMNLCHRAGVNVIMATGDQALTAQKIASEINLLHSTDNGVLHGADLKEADSWSDELKRRIKKSQVFCRVSPEQKLDLVNFWQQQGKIVAVTGDGINDAPALKKSDIGVAMGIRGTQVAKDVSEMILKDDNFSTIIAAIQQGRIVFENIRRFVVYLLSCNISEVLVIGIASMINAPLPILPLQILFLNLVTDVFPALALGMNEGDKNVLFESPRGAKEDILTPWLWRTISIYGIIITLCVLSTFFISLMYLALPVEKAVTVAFLTIGFCQVFHVFNMRGRLGGIVVNDVSKNPHVWGAVILCSCLLFGAVYIPGLNKVLNLVPLNSKELLMAIGTSLVPLLLGPFLRVKSSA